MIFCGILWYLTEKQERRPSVQRWWLDRMQPTSNWSLCGQGVGELLSAHPSGGKANPNLLSVISSDKIFRLHISKFQQIHPFQMVHPKCNKKSDPCSFHFVPFFLVALMLHSNLSKLMQPDLKWFLNLTWTPFVYIPLAFLAGDCHIPKGVSRRSSQPWRYMKI